MELAYPARFKKAGKTVVAEFPDVPEAHTVGADVDDAYAWAQDALVVALGAYMDESRDIPAPSVPRKGQRLVALPPLEAAKHAIYRTMRG